MSQFLDWLLDRVPTPEISEPRRRIAEGTYQEALPLEERAALVREGLEGLLSETNSKEDRAHMLEGAAAGGALGLSTLPAALSGHLLLDGIVTRRSQEAASKMEAGLLEALNGVSPQARETFGSELQGSLSRRLGMNSLPGLGERLSPNPGTRSSWVVDPVRELGHVRRKIAPSVVGGGSRPSQMIASAVEEVLNSKRLQRYPDDLQALNGRLKKEIFRTQLMAGEKYLPTATGEVARSAMLARSIPTRMINQMHGLTSKAHSAIKNKGLLLGGAMTGLGMLGGTIHGKLESDREQKATRARLESLEEADLMKSLLGGDRDRARAKARFPGSPLRERSVPSLDPDRFFTGALQSFLERLDLEAESHSLDR